jgi:GTPase SAR1 family protein
MVVGNKSDLKNEKKVAPDDCSFDNSKYKFEIDYWEVSAKTGHNINEMFTQVFESNFVLKEEIHKKKIKVQADVEDDNKDNK